MSSDQDNFITYIVFENRDNQNFSISASAKRDEKTKPFKQISVSCKALKDMSNLTIKNGPNKMKGMFKKKPYVAKCLAAMLGKAVSSEEDFDGALNALDDLLPEFALDVFIPAKTDLGYETGTFSIAQVNSLKIERMKVDKLPERGTPLPDADLKNFVGSVIAHPCDSMFTSLRHVATQVFVEQAESLKDAPYIRDVILSSAFILSPQLVAIANYHTLSPNLIVPLYKKIQSGEGFASSSVQDYLASVFEIGPTMKNGKFKAIYKIEFDPKTQNKVRATVAVTSVDVGSLLM